MLNIISNLGENAKLNEIRGFNQVVAWSLHDAFGKLGYPSRLVSDEADCIPAADNALVVSNRAMLKMRQMSLYGVIVRRATGRKLALYLDADFSVGYPYDITFTVVPPRMPGRFVYAGWGANPCYCHPDQGEKAVFLDRQGRTENSRIRAEQARMYQTYLRVLPTTGAKIYRYDQLFKKAVPWVEAQKTFGKCHYYCCTQYCESNLSRIEATTCGAMLVVPARLYMPRTMGPLSHAIWSTEDELKGIIAADTDPGAISTQARKQTWDAVARRIMARLG